jgi:hypothetical protein
VKFVMCRLAALGFVLACCLVVAAGCSVSHRSGDFACKTTADCSRDRTCVEGLCVVSAVDAGAKADGPPIGDAAVCPSQCTSCNVATKSCTIDCALSGNACNQAITCPAGWDCIIGCSTNGSCRNGINCQNSKSCTITCGAAQSCRNVSCGAGPCNIDCAGNGSCRDVSCGASCACDVTCRINSACLNLTCKSPPDCTGPLPFGGCTSQNPGCNTCPVL